MKKIISLLAALVLMFSLCGSFAAFADSDIKNEVLISDISSEDFPRDIYESWLNDIEKEKKVQRPKKSSYMESIDVYYVDAPKGHSIYAYTKPDSDSKKQPVVYHGTRVLVWAVEDGWACITYQNEIFEAYLAWVNVDNLSQKPTSEVVELGEKSEYELTDMSWSSPPLQEWSSFNFVDSKTKYVEIGESELYVTDRYVGMDIYYKVISRNGVKDASGERNVYINDGSGWEYMGSFEVNKELEPVCIRVSYGMEREIKAVAVIPTNSEHEACEVSQQIQRMYYT